jgi:hypothetical protein
VIIHAGREIFYRNLARAEVRRHFEQTRHSVLFCLSVIISNKSSWTVVTRPGARIPIRGLYHKQSKKFNGRPVTCDIHVSSLVHATCLIAYLRTPLLGLGRLVLKTFRPRSNLSEQFHFIFDLSLCVTATASPTSPLPSLFF